MSADRKKNGSTEGSVHIAEKVRFWEEQDRINKVLIPRVIRQSELLSKHIAEHDDLSRLFNTAIADALSNQSSQFEAEVARTKQALQEAFANTLEQATAEQARQIRQELDAAFARLDQNQQKFNSDLVERFEAVVAGMREESEKFSRICISIAAVALLVAVLATVLAW